MDIYDFLITSLQKSYNNSINDIVEIYSRL